MKSLFTYKNPIPALGVAVACGVCFLLALGVMRAPSAGQAGLHGGRYVVVASRGPGTRAPADRHRYHFGQLELRACEQPYCPQPPLYRKSGNVQREPWLFLIFWGKNWLSKGALLEKQLVKMYKSISGSAYQGILTQYFDGTGHIGSALKVVTPYIDEKVAAPSELTKEQLETEVKEAISTNKWPKSENGQYIVFTAPGSTYHEKLEETSGCAFHADVEKGVSYSFVPYRGDPAYAESSCKRKGDVNGETMGSASHEYAESATDPFILAASEYGWVTKDEKYEITDICAPTLYELSEGIWVQAQWDNSQGTCLTSDANPALVLGITEEAGGASEAAAKLKAQVNPEEAETTYFFEWGPLAKPTEHKTAEAKAGAGKNNVIVEQEIGALTPKTEYAFNVVVKNSKGTVKGLQMKVKTL